MDTEPTFERRRHQRYRVALQATFHPKGMRDPAETLACAILDLSRHGVHVEGESGDGQSLPAPALAVQLPDGSNVTMGVKLLRQQPSGIGRATYSCQLVFGHEGARKQLHEFLKGIRDERVPDRRGSDRRKITDVNVPDRRRRNRRRHFGIFTESMTFAPRAPRWKSTYTYYPHVEASDPGHVVIGGRSLISYSSKDYLGLAHDSRLKEASIRALERYGTTAWSRVLNGTLDLHEDLERELAAYKGTEAALLFSGGYIANITILAALLKTGDVVFLDERVHISLVEGTLASGARVVRFRHNSVKDLVRKIERVKNPRCLIIVDGVYSVEGDLADLPQLRKVADTYNIPVLVDDAHGIGVMGQTGSGTPEHFGLRGKMELEVASFSGAFAGVGGFIACKQEVADYLLHFSNGVMFTTSLAPATLAGALEALRIMRTDTARRDTLWRNVYHLRGGLESLGYRLCPTGSAVISIEVGNEERAYEAVRALEARGIAVNAFRRPAVKRGEAKVRMSVSAAHSEQDIDLTLKAFSDVRSMMGSSVIDS